jgi:hypothetical protein
VLHNLNQTNIHFTNDNMIGLISCLIGRNIHKKLDSESLDTLFLRGRQRAPSVFDGLLQDVNCDELGLNVTTTFHNGGDANPSIGVLLEESYLVLNRLSFHLVPRGIHQLNSGIQKVDIEGCREIEKPVKRGKEVHSEV